MSHIEGSEGQQPPEQRVPPVEIGIKPFADAGIIFEQAEDGRLILKTTGEITIAILPSKQAAESPVKAAETPTRGLIAESTPPPVTEPHSGSDKPSWERSLKDGEELPESENEKFQVTGNVARIGRYRVTKKTNTKIADLVLASHPDKSTTEYWRIRGFNDEALKIREQIEVGQQGIEATIYGPKYWRGRKKTQDGWEETVVKGYHAGFLKIPRTKQQKPPQE